MDWIRKIAAGITETFNRVRKPVTSVPPALLLCEAQNRPGLSAMALSSAVIARLAAEGYETGVNPDGSENLNNKFIYILCDELIKEIKSNAVIEATIPIGSISITGVGGNAGGPVTIEGYNDKLTSVKGLMM